MALQKLTDQQIKDDPEQQLKNFKRTKDFLVAIDTDGCVTDNMNGKQMVIFHPQYLEFYHLNLYLYKLLAWSEAVNRTFPYVNLKIPPFRKVKESLELMVRHADVLVVSQTPYEDLTNYRKGEYAGKPEEELIARFARALLTTPPWEEQGYDHVKAYREKQEIRKSLYANLNPGGQLLIL